jgi:transposase
MNTNRIIYEDFKDLKCNFLQIPEIEYSRHYSSKASVREHMQKLLCECSSILKIDEKRGEIVCPVCGLVHDGVYLDGFI